MDGETAPVMLASELWSQPGETSIGLSGCCEEYMTTVPSLATMPMACWATAETAVVLKTAAAPSPSVRRLTSSTASTWVGSMQMSAPSFLASSRRGPSGSLMMTRQPESLAHMTCSWPMMPPPITTTSSPISRWPRSMELSTQASGSAKQAFSRGRSSLII